MGSKTVTESRAGNGRARDGGRGKKSVGAHPRKGSAPTPCSSNGGIVDDEKEIVKAAMAAAVSGDPLGAMKIAGVDPDGRVAKLLRDVAMLAEGCRVYNAKHPDRRGWLADTDRKTAEAAREAAEYFNVIDAELCDDAEIIRKLIAEEEIEDLSAGSLAIFVDTHGDSRDARDAIAALLPFCRSAFANWRHGRTARRERYLRTVEKELGDGGAILRGREGGSRDGT